MFTRVPAVILKEIAAKVNDTSRGERSLCWWPSAARAAPPAGTPGQFPPEPSAGSRGREVASIPQPGRAAPPRCSAAHADTQGPRPYSSPGEPPLPRRSYRSAPQGDFPAGTRTSPARGGRTGRAGCGVRVVAVSLFVPRRAGALLPPHARAVSAAGDTHQVEGGLQQKDRVPVHSLHPRRSNFPRAAFAASLFLPEHRSTWHPLYRTSRALTSLDKNEIIDPMTTRQG